MSIFTNILEKLGLRKPAPTPQTGPSSGPYIPPGSHPAAIPMVDVVSKLEAMAAKKGEKSNWKVSIADLLYLLGIDNSLEARKELAVELGCPQDVMADNIKMNTWLHKTVLAKIAENGGNIPPELLN